MTGWLKQAAVGAKNVQDGDKVKILKPVTVSSFSAEADKTIQTTLNPADVLSIATGGPDTHQMAMLFVSDSPEEPVGYLDQLYDNYAEGTDFEIIKEAGASQTEGEASVKVQADGDCCEEEIAQFMKDHPEVSREDAEKAVHDAKAVQAEAPPSEVPPAEAPPIDAGWLAPEDATPPEMTASQAQAMVVKAFAYTDLAGQMNAAYVLGTAQRTIFNEAISEAWKQHGKECKAAVEKLSKWGAPVSMPAIRDVVAKILIANKIHAFPAVVAAISDKFKSANPFQTTHMLPDERGDQQTGSKLARS